MYYFSNFGCVLLQENVRVDCMRSIHENVVDYYGKENAGKSPFCFVIFLLPVVQDDFQVKKCIVVVLQADYFLVYAINKLE